MKRFLIGILFFLSSGAAWAQNTPYLTQIIPTADGLLVLHPNGETLEIRHCLTQNGRPIDVDAMIPLQAYDPNRPNNPGRRDLAENLRGFVGSLNLNECPVARTIAKKQLEDRMNGFNVQAGGEIIGAMIVVGVIGAFLFPPADAAVWILIAPALTAAGTAYVVLQPVDTYNLLDFSFDQPDAMDLEGRVSDGKLVVLGYRSQTFEDLLASINNAVP